jgi:hypothetical protein
VRQYRRRPGIEGNAEIGLLKLAALILHEDVVLAANRFSND